MTAQPSLQFKNSRPTVDEVRALVARGYTDSQMARELGTTDGWVYKFRRRHAIATAYPRPLQAKPVVLDEEDVEASDRAYTVRAPSLESLACMRKFFRKQHYEDITDAEILKLTHQSTKPVPLYRPHYRSVTALILGDPR